MISELIGKTLIRIDGLSVGSDTALFVCDEGSEFLMYHSQDCCENVEIEDICGEVADLLNSPVLTAEESTSDKNPDGKVINYQDSFTWTFYKIGTAKGDITIRWYGSSNGCYSERVTFERTSPKQEED